MTLFCFRNRRISVDIPVDLYLMMKNTGRISDDSLPAKIVSLSKGGASLAVNSMIVSGRHLFFHTQKTEKFYVFIPKISEGENQLLSDVLAVSVWMDGTSEKGRSSFKMGIEFLEKQPELYQHYKKML